MEQFSVGNYVIMNNKILNLSFSFLFFILLNYLRKVLTIPSDYFQCTDTYYIAFQFEVYKKITLQYKFYVPMSFYLL